MAFTQGSTVGGMGSLITSVAVAGGMGFGAASQGMEKGKQVLEAKVRENISKTCHNLASLAAMGHPYSALNPNNPHPEKPYLIHKETGNLLNAVRSGTRARAGSAEAWVGIDESVAPYARCLVEGTPRMIARDFLSGSREEVKGEVASMMKAGVGRVLLGAALFFQIARYAKWVSKFAGGSPIVSNMYKAARFARNAEVICQGQPLGLSRRFVNVVMMGRVAKQFMVPGGGPLRVGGAVVNKYIMQSYGRRLFKPF